MSRTCGLHELHIVHARTVCKRGDDFDACTRGYLPISDCTWVDSFESSVAFGHLEQTNMSGFNWGFLVFVAVFGEACFISLLLAFPSIWRYIRTLIWWCYFEVIWSLDCSLMFNDFLGFFCFISMLLPGAGSTCEATLQKLYILQTINRVLLWFLYTVLLWHCARWLGIEWSHSVNPEFRNLSCTMVQGMPGEVCDAKRCRSLLCAEWFDIAACEDCWSQNCGIFLWYIITIELNYNCYMLRYSCSTTSSTLDALHWVFIINEARAARLRQVVFSLWHRRSKSATNRCGQRGIWDEDGAEMFFFFGFTVIPSRLECCIDMLKVEWLVKTVAALTSIFLYGFPSGCPCGALPVCLPFSLCFSRRSLEFV